MSEHQYTQEGNFNHRFPMVNIEQFDHNVRGLDQYYESKDFQQAVSPPPGLSGLKMKKKTI